MRTAHLQYQLEAHSAALTAFLQASKSLCTRLSSLAPIVPARIRFTPPLALQIGVTKDSAIELLRFAEEKAVELMAVKERLMGTAMPPSNPGSRPGTGYRSASRPGTGVDVVVQRRGSVSGRRRSSVFFGVGSTIRNKESDSDGEDTGHPSRKGSSRSLPKKEVEEKKNGWVPFETPSVTREEWDAPESEEEEGVVGLLSREDMMKIAKANVGFHQPAQVKGSFADAESSFSPSRSNDGNVQRQQSAQLHPHLPTSGQRHLQNDPATVLRLLSLPSRNPRLRIQRRHRRDRAKMGPDRRVERCRLEG